MLAIALVVMLMITSVSIFSGFLNKIELAAKGLFGDIVVEPSSMIGLGYYDEFISLTAGGSFELPVSRLHYDTKNKELFLYPGSQVDSFNRLENQSSYMKLFRYANKLTGQKKFPVSLTVGKISASHLAPRNRADQQRRASSVSGYERAFPDEIKTTQFAKVRGFAVLDGVKLKLVLDSKDADKLKKIAAAQKSLKPAKTLAVIGEITLDKGMPEIQAGDPFILSIGMLSLANWSQHVQIAGVRLPGRGKVSSFEKGMFVQRENGKPVTFDPTIKQMKQAWVDERQRIKDVITQKFGKFLKAMTPQERQSLLTHWRGLKSKIIKMNSGNTEKYPLTIGQKNFLNRLGSVQEVIWQSLKRLEHLEREYGTIQNLQKQIEAKKLAGASETEIDDLQEELEELTGSGSGLHWETPDNRIILGYGLQGLSIQADGEMLRFIGPSRRVVLDIAQTGQRINSANAPLAKRAFYIVDENRSGVASIDRKLVYIPFETLQLLNKMDANGSMPARCSQIHFKVAPEFDTRQKLPGVAAKMQSIMNQFHIIFPLASQGNSISVETWRQRQRDVLTPVQNQRTLIFFFGGMFSFVLPTLVFVIFYTIVSQKTKEMGLLKALGASSRGVASIFLAYGFVIGLIGGIIGIISAYYITVNINHIHDWIAGIIGVKIWTARVFMFDQIPNEMDYNAAIIILIGAVLSSIVGASWPAFRAGSMQPIKAIRYE